SWLSNWRTMPPEGDRRPVLVLDFSAPVSGTWQVTLEMAPRTTFPRTFNLPFPAAVGARSATPVFAWRSLGADVTDVAPDAASPLSPTEFLKTYGLPAKVEADPRPPTAAYQRSNPAAAPTLRLRVNPAPPARATTDIVWRIDSRSAEFEATARI